MNQEQSRRILMADDDGEFRGWLGEAVFSGCQIDKAYDAQSAIALAREHDYDLITLDNRMPDHLANQGVYAAGEIKKMERHRTTPILLITSDREFEIATGALAAGVQEVIYKDRAHGAHHAKLSDYEIGRVKGYLDGSLPANETRDNIL